MLLARKLISPDDRRKYVIDYADWLDTIETLATVTFTVDDGPATVPSSAIAGDGKSVTFHVTGAVTDTPVFNIFVEATTSTSQIKHDHVEFDVVEP